MWRAYWDRDGQGNTARHQHRAAAFGWLVLTLLLSALAFGLGHALEVVGGEAWGNRYGQSGISGALVLAPMLLCVYHFLLSTLVPDAPPGPFARWSISWATDLALVATAILLTT
jgi:hypothetical protein